MVIIESLLRVAGELVPVDEFVGPIIDQDYIEGAIVLTVDNKPILTREMVDYVDQLWAYLLQALEEIVGGREVSTCYPDMPIELRFRPHGDRVTINLASRKTDAEANVPIDELCQALASAGSLFFSKLRSFVPRDHLVYDQYMARLDVLARSTRDSGRQ